MALFWKRKENDDQFVTVKPGEVQFLETQPEPPADVAPVVPSVASPAAPASPYGISKPPSEAVPLSAPSNSGLFGRMKTALSDRLQKTRDEFVGKIREAVKAAGKVDEHLVERIEEILIQADLGGETTARIVDQMNEFEARGANPEELLASFKKELRDIIGNDPQYLAPAGRKPYVLLIIGVNGVGKTTTIGKLAAEFKDKGLRTMIVAGDTFRAAAIDQLKIWAERTGSGFVSKGMGSDPAGTAYDGITAAVEGGYDVVLIDTAGRLHTKTNLMEEMKKIGRVIEKVLPGAPHETLLVLDATTGQNAISQARVFSEAVPLTGIVMTKLDGTAKGGVLIGIRNLFPFPVVKIGIGEGIDDLRDFHPGEFVDALFAE